MHSRVSIDQAINTGCLSRNPLWAGFGERLDHVGDRNGGRMVLGYSQISVDQTIDIVDVQVLTPFGLFLGSV